MAEKKAYPRRSAPQALFGQALSLSRAFLGLVVSGFGLEAVWGWKDCTISPEDQWRAATERTPALAMRYEFPRRYTCVNEPVSFMAASYYFDSPCTGDGFWFPPDVLKCLEDRRVIFVGDSISVQQGYSLVGMLGWHPYWIKSRNPLFSGIEAPTDGLPIKLAPMDCWPHPDIPTGMEICWDLYDSDFPPGTGDQSGGAPSPREPSVRMAGQEGATAEGKIGRNISVHTRNFGMAKGHDWFNRVVADFNGTRSSDVFVVNFGVHYHDTPEHDQEYRDAVFPILDQMAEVGKTATVIWREISPVHFPSRNGSYDTWIVKDREERRDNCCTGDPPRVLPRNAWVEDYLRDNGLTDYVKVLRVYDMSLPRGSAHHTCHMAPPSTMAEGTATETSQEPPVCHTKHDTDCTHWSATGVVEEWNSLMLNHLCPAA